MIESSLVEKALGMMVDEKLNLNWQRALSPESQRNPGLHPKELGQQVTEGASAPLLHTCETSPAVLHPVL